MQRLFSALGNFYRWWQHEKVSVKTASVYVLLLSALFFLLGSHHPQSDYRRLEKKVADAKAEMRLFADEVARRNGMLNNMRARDNLNKKTIELLNNKIGLLEAQSINWQEQTAFYRHVLESKTPGGDIVIHALDATPDFARQGWSLSAILARLGKRKAFNGSYYFEVVETHTDGSHTIIRLPQEGGREFSMNFYYEIKEQIDIEPDKTIANLRVVILDNEGKSIASAELGNRFGENGNES